jgi:hypothetical protein
MKQLLDLAAITWQTFTLMFTDLRYILILLLVFSLVYRQYAKTREYEQGFFGLKRIDPLRETAVATIYGLAGGLLATVLFIVLGISLSNAGAAYLWLAAILLMLFHPRFLCFSYAGSLVSIAHLVTGYPDIHIPTLMALVAVLHLVESALIFVDGHHGSSPMFFKHKSGRVVGGFALRKFWPMPTIALVGLAVAGPAVEWQTVAMPDWWPVFRAGIDAPEGYVFMYMLFPLVVALGYSDFVQTELPRTKARRSAGVLLAYSVVLLGLALAANAYPVLSLLPVLFAPLGHELVIRWSQWREQSREPVFHAADGVMVLSVYPGSPAEQMGLQPGDVIKSVNGAEVKDLSQLVNEISPWAVDPVFVVENQFLEPRRREVRLRGKVPPLGIIPAPHPAQGTYMQFKEGFLRSLWNRWRAKRK